MARPEKHSRSIFLMSDEGYRNTLGVAADILEELRMPWTLFVSTAHIGTGLPNPVFLLWLFFLRAPQGEYRLPNFAETVRLDRKESREKWARRGSNHLRFLPAEQAEEKLAVMRAAFAPVALVLAS